MTDEFRHYRRWFYAAALYNAAWGSDVVLFPGTLLRLAGMNTTVAVPLVQVIGMMVGVYASRCTGDPRIRGIKNMWLRTARVLRPPPFGAAR